MTGDELVNGVLRKTARILGIGLALILVVAFIVGMYFLNHYRWGGCR